MKNIRLVASHSHNILSILAVLFVSVFSQIVSAATVVEFYNPDLDNYFITADPGEQAFVDTGAVGNWTRTGNTFLDGGPNQVCRFFGGPLGPNSHFYTADARECADLKSIYNPAIKTWKFESNDFSITPASTTGSKCPANYLPVYRAYNNGQARGVDSNHRITTSFTAIAEVVANGWQNEGVVACSGPVAAKTSYEHMTGYGLSRIKFVTDSAPVWLGEPEAWGAGDFFETGRVDIFTTKHNYNLNTTYAEIQADPAKYASDYDFWQQNTDGTLTKIWAAPNKGCLHPRKGVVADFNQDGYPDVFVACHGYDAPVNGQMVGEKSDLVLSDCKGGFTIKKVDIDGIAASFNHGASAADVNSDGYPDIVVADILNPLDWYHPVYFLINQKDGTFKSDYTRIQNLTDHWSPYFSVELLDVDGDGNLDLFVGGHEHEQAETKILYGDGTGTFGKIARVIPPVTDRGAVLGVVRVTNNGKTGLFVNRTGSGAAGFYSRRTLQWVDVNTFESVVVLDHVNNTNPLIAGWENTWLPVTKNGQNGVDVYNANDPANLFTYH